MTEEEHGQRIKEQLNEWLELPLSETLDKLLDNMAGYSINWLNNRDIEISKVITDGITTYQVVDNSKG